jgi:hypothetical protein
MLDSLQQKDMLLIAQGRTYQERKDELKAYSERMAGTVLRLVGHPNGTAANQALRRAA